MTRLSQFLLSPIGRNFSISAYLRHMVLFEENIEDRKLFAENPTLQLRESLHYDSTDKQYLQRQESQNSQLDQLLPDYDSQFKSQLPEFNQVAQLATWTARRQQQMHFSKFSHIHIQKKDRSEVRTKFRFLQRVNTLILTVTLIRNFIQVIYNVDSAYFAYVSDSTLAFEKGRTSVGLCHLISVALILYMYRLFDRMRKLHYSHPFRLWLHLYQQRLDVSAPPYERRRLQHFWHNSNVMLHTIFNVYFVCFWPTVLFTYSASYYISYLRIYQFRHDLQTYLYSIAPNFLMVAYFSYQIYLLLLFTPYLFHVLIRYFLLKLRLVRLRIQFLRSRKMVGHKAISKVLRHLLNVLIQLQGANLFWKHAIAVFYLFAVLNTELILYVIFNSYSVPVQVSLKKIDLIDPLFTFHWLKKRCDMIKK